MCKFPVDGNIAHQPLLVLENYSDYPFVWCQNIGSIFVRFVTKHACDRRTELRSEDRAGVAALHGKKETAVTVSMVRDEWQDREADGLKTLQNAHRLRTTRNTISIIWKIMLHKQERFSKLPNFRGTTLYSAICQVGCSIGAKKLANADILLFWLNFFSDQKQVTHPL